MRAARRGDTVWGTQRRLEQGFLYEDCRHEFWMISVVHAMKRLFVHPCRVYNKVVSLDWCTENYTSAILPREKRAGRLSQQQVACPKRLRLVLQGRLKKLWIAKPLMLSAIEFE